MLTNKDSDKNVNHPAHYEAGPFECIDLTKKFDFTFGNAIKYVYRHDLKSNSLQDLKKALWYLDNTNWVWVYLRILFRPSIRKQLGVLEDCDWANAGFFWRYIRLRKFKAATSVVKGMIMDIKDRINL